MTGPNGDGLHIDRYGFSTPGYPAEYGCGRRSRFDHARSGAAPLPNLAGPEFCLPVQANGNQRLHGITCREPMLVIATSPSTTVRI
jgi:hypothetical protein